MKHLDSAYQNFFRTKQGFPKFKSKRNKNSFTVPQHIKLKDNRIVVPKFKSGIKLNSFQGFNGQIKQCTFSKDCRNNYFVSILVETKIEPYKPTGKYIGIDLGIKELIIDSNGTKHENPRNTKKHDNIS